MSKKLFSYKFNHLRKQHSSVYLYKWFFQGCKDDEEMRRECLYIFVLNELVDQFQSRSFSTSQSSTFLDISAVLYTV